MLIDGNVGVKINEHFMVYHDFPYGFKYIVLRVIPVANCTYNYGTSPLSKKANHGK